MDGNAHYVALHMAQTPRKVQIGVGKPCRVATPEHIHENRPRKLAE